MNKVIKLADLPTSTGKVHQYTGVYDGRGISCTLQARDYKDPPKVLIVRKGDAVPGVIKLGDLPTSTGKVHQDTGVYDGGVSHAHSER